jgi:hypothetical protein
MIYTRWNNEVKIIAQCGKLQPPYLSYPLYLARIEITFVNERQKMVRHEFINYLKADGGWNEICDAYNSAPVLKLTDVELEKAFKEAQ